MRPAVGRSWIKLESEGFHWPCNVLESHETNRFESQLKVFAYMIPHRTRDADAACWALRFQPRGNIHSIAVQTCVIDDDVANVDANAESNLLARWLIPVVDRNLLLHLDRTTNRTVDAVEGDEQRVAPSLYQLPTVLPYRRIYHRMSKRLLAPKRSGVI